MTSIFIIITALTKAAQASGTPHCTGSVDCSFTNATEAQQCYGVVGQPLIFHLSDIANTDARLKKDNKYVILKTNKKRIVNLHVEYAKHAELSANGTFTLGNATKNHSGDYMLEKYGPNGNLVEKVNVHLEIYAPVSKPALSQVCLSPDQMNISCSSRGETVEFVFTLDGVLLMQTSNHSQFLYSMPAHTQPLTGTQTENTPVVTKVTISLHGLLSGNLTCYVWNNVCREETVIHLDSCKGTNSPSSVSDGMAVRNSVGTVLLLSLCLAVCTVHWKTRTRSIQEDIQQNKISTEL